MTSIVILHRPVSYTHLDVYKRQAISTVTGPPAPAPDGEKIKKIRKWYKQCRCLDIPVSGPILKEKATEFEKLFGIDFTCSNGWLDRFKARHSISFAKICGEAKCVELNLTGDWVRNTWPQIRRLYKDEDIFNGCLLYTSRCV